MTIILDPYIIPEKGQVELNVSRSFEIKVTAEEARRQINRWLMNEVNLLISADSPTLVVGDQVVWRAMAWISFPHTGRAGMVGAVEVNVTTGAMNNTQELKAEIERQAEEVANRQPSYRPKDKVPERYLAKNVPPAPTLHIHEDGTLAVVTASEKEHA
jgi:hypothetical protein